MHKLQDDIEKYLSGKLSPTEMHALEKKALDDPFLAEALEGGSSISPDDFISDVKSLQSAIAKANPEKSTQSFSWKWPLRIAAGLLLLAASTFIVLNIVDEETTTDSIALNKTEEETQQSTSTPNLSDSVSSGSEVKIERDAIKSSTEASPAKKEKQPNEEDQPEETPEENETNLALDSEKPKEHLEESIEEKAEADNVISTPSLAQEELKKDDGAKMKRSLNEKEAHKGRAADVAQSAPSGAPSSVKVNGTSKIIKGKVTDEDDGLPLPGVNVSVKGASVGTVTDLNGNYEISVPENQNNVVFSYIGMEIEEVVVKQDQKESEQINVQMTPDVSELSEVVVTGYGTGEEKEFEGTKWELTEPEGGKKEYRNYLEKNIQYPQVALKNNVEGKVTVQFTVEPNGQLTEFRVVKSLGSGCDDEVIRLIKEGPKWMPTKRNDEPVKSKAKVKLRFELPGKKK